MSIVLFAPAKLTVSLRVTGARPDGYHEVDAEMVSLDLGDRLVVSEGDGLEVVAVGSGLPVAALLMLCLFTIQFLFPWLWFNYLTLPVCLHPVMNPLLMIMKMENMMRANLLQTGMEMVSGLRWWNESDWMKHGKLIPLYPVLI